MGLHIRIALGLALCSFIKKEFNIGLEPNKISIQVFKTHTHTQTHTHTDPYTHGHTDPYTQMHKEEYIDVVLAGIK